MRKIATCISGLICVWTLGSQLIAQSAVEQSAPVKIIFDTDMDSDCDDVAALALLHVLADKEEAKILATGISSKNEWAAPCTDAINTYYGRPGLPIGGPRSVTASLDQSRYAQGIAEKFPHTAGMTTSLPQAAQLYRKVLLAQPDHSVTIVTVGDLTNIAELLQLSAENSVPAGIDVAKTKVSTWVCMGGNFIGKPAADDLKLTNNNFTVDKPGTRYALAHWPGKIMFVGREVASVPSGVKIGAKFGQLPADHPVRVGYELYFGGQAKDRHIADIATVLYAVRGARDYWDVESAGFMNLKNDITFTWDYSQNKGQGYLLKKKINGMPNDGYIEKILEELVMTPRKK